jgi:hypothetical protein
MDSLKRGRPSTSTDTTPTDAAHTLLYYLRQACDSTESVSTEATSPTPMSPASAPAVGGAGGPPSAPVKVKIPIPCAAQDDNDDDLYGDELLECVPKNLVYHYEDAETEGYARATGSGKPEHRRDLGPSLDELDEDDEDDEDDDEDSDDDTDNDTDENCVTEIAAAGRVSFTPRLSVLFKTFGLDMKDVHDTMMDTSAVIGGGFMVNHLMTMTGYCRPLHDAADLDFFVFGGVVPQYPLGTGDDKAVWDEYNSRRIKEQAFKSMVLRRFNSLFLSGGYHSICPTEWKHYETEKTDAGDRIFTTGSNIRMTVHYYQAIVNGIIKNINLVFCDTNMYELIKKIDISLCAGFINASAFGYGYGQMFEYHHAAPSDINCRRLTWMQPESTHTPRQFERLGKYHMRYAIPVTRIMTTAEFIRDYDSLPDAGYQLVLKGTEDEIYASPVIRRVRGLPEIRVSVDMIYGCRNQFTRSMMFPSAVQIAEYTQRNALPLLAPL